MKSFRPEDEPKDPGDSNGWSHFKGGKRSNATHESRTDPEAGKYAVVRGSEELEQRLAEAEISLVVDETRKSIV